MFDTNFEITVLVKKNYSISNGAASNEAEPNLKVEKYFLNDMYLRHYPYYVNNSS